MKRSTLLLVGIISASFATARGDEPQTGTLADRIVEGRVVDDHGAPIPGAMVLLSLADPPRPFTKEATARTDAQGRYRVVLTNPRWASLSLRSLALAPGFKLATRAVAPGARSATADFTLSPEPWKTTEVRLVDLVGRPVPGVELTCTIPLGVPWSQLMTDAAGRCRVTMAIDQPCALLGNPQGARPITVSLANLKNDPAMTVSLLPPIRGRVHNPDGRPLADVSVGRMVIEENGAPRMNLHNAGSPIKTDAEGRFDLAPNVLVVSGETKQPGEYRPPTTICFADKAFTHFAFRLVDLSGPVEPMDVTLGPGRPVNIRVERGSAPPSPHASVVLTLAMVDRPEIFKVGPNVWMKILDHGNGSGTASIRIALPEGRYVVTVESGDAKTHSQIGHAQRELVVGPGTELLDLPVLRLDATFHQQMAGKPAPEIETTDLNTDRPVHLADFRGKVVILDFWGYWCGPCVSSMPYLIQLHRRFEGRPLAIVAVHDQSVQSRNEYDRRIAQIRKKLWDDRDLPFLVVLDRPDPAKAPERFAEGTGQTCHRYGIEAFPTLFVIDQRGTMVGEIQHAEHDKLEAIVRDLLEKPASP